MNEAVSIAGNFASVCAVIGAAVLWGRYRKAVDVLEQSQTSFREAHERAHVVCREEHVEQLQKLDERENEHCHELREVHQSLRDDTLTPFMVKVSAQLSAVAQKVADAIPTICARIDRLEDCVNKRIDGMNKRIDCISTHDGANS